MAGPLLAGAEFDVVAIDGADVVPGSSPTIAFGLDGRVSGRATLNRLMGHYELDGDALRLGALATTMMAGPEELMAQEQRVLQVLGGGALTVVPAVDSDLLLASDAGELLLRPARMDDGAGDDEADDDGPA